MGTPGGAAVGTAVGAKPRPAMGRRHEVGLGPLANLRLEHWASRARNVSFWEVFAP